VTRHTSQGGAAGIRGPRKKRSNAQQARDLRRRVEHLNQQTGHARDVRRQSWLSGGQSEFVTERQDKALRNLEAGKRGLRRDVYDFAPELEGDPFYRTPGWRR
jgi:hypothetical protein